MCQQQSGLNCNRTVLTAHTKHTQSTSSGDGRLCHWVLLKELSENFYSMKRDTETTKKNQSDMKDTLVEIKNILQEINSTAYEAKNQISNLEDKEAKNTQ